MKSRAATPLVLSLALAAAALAHACSSGSPGDAIGHSRTGLACYTDAQCGLDSCNTGLFDGGACVGTCDSAGACPDEPVGGPGQVCLGGPGRGGCLRACETDGGCIRDGWVCQNGLEGGRVCLPDCRTDINFCENLTGTIYFVCSTFDGICRIPIPPDAGLYGQCDSLESCIPPATCIALTGERGRGGTCTVPCTVAAGDGGLLDGGASDAGSTTDSCPSGGACVVAVPDSLLDGGSELYCGVPCGSDAGAGASCAPGLSCQQLPGGELPDGGPITISLCAP